MGADQIKTSIDKIAGNEVFKCLQDMAEDKAHPDKGRYLTLLVQDDLVQIINLVRADVYGNFEPIINQNIDEEENPELVTAVLETIRRATSSKARDVFEKRYLATINTISLVTGLPNQRVGLAALKQLIKNEHEFAWTFFDLDRLKSLNLALGEDTTDRLLKSVGEVLKANVRTNEESGKNDMVIHRSGDEFWLILNEANLTEGMIASEKLLQNLRENPISITLTEDNIKYMERVAADIQSRDPEYVEEFESIALRSIQDILSQVEKHEQEGTFRHQRQSDMGKKTYNINISVTASMGCVPHNPQDVIINSDEELREYFDELSISVKCAEERAKQSGRNCVLGYDGGRYYRLLSDKRLLRLNAA